MNDRVEFEIMSTTGLFVDAYGEAMNASDPMILAYRSGDFREMTELCKAYCKMITDNIEYNLGEDERDEV